MQIAVTLSQLSVAYYDLGQPHRSIELLERALDINKNIHGPAHISVAITTSNMSTAYRHLGEVTKSKELAEEALKMTEELHGPAHPGTYTMA
jgi:tetratricopeptide (TPR) repeat protein